MPMSSKIAVTTSKKHEAAQKETEEPKPGAHLMLHDLTQVVLDMLDHMCRTDGDVDNLVNETKPKLEAILRRFE